MSASRRRFTQEFKDELCREVTSTSKPIRGGHGLRGRSGDSLSVAGQVP